MEKKEKRAIWLIDIKFDMQKFNIIEKIDLRSELAVARVMK